MDVLEVVSELVRTKRGALAAAAREEGVGHEDAVDCVQEGLCTLLTLHQRSALPEDTAEWGPMLTGIVRNVARNRRRRHHLARPHEALDTHHQLAEDRPATDELIARAEQHVRLRSCVAELCEIQQAVVTLRMLEEQSGEDTAQALGISQNYVAVLLLRAKQSLRACMSAS